ncbi:MAG: DNA topoisomerase, partial [Clostridia bacterium]|nr:DNA topoisomerase [Clostridia bacterium]
EVAFCASNTVKMLEYYHNSSFLEHGGSPEKAVKNAFVFALDKFLKNQGKYNKNESKITFVDVEDALVLVTNSFSTQTSYENQTKKAITNTFIAEAMTSFLKEKLEIYFIEKPMEAEKFANQVLINKRSRESAESARIKVKVNLTGKMDITNKVEKFVNCRSKDPEKRELYIVEGDSALSSCKLGRAAEFQAIIPVRGKTLNCLKSSYERIFKSDIIVDLLRVIGCGVELDKKIKTDIARFDYDMLRWNKIIICTDADEDGFQIRTLLLTIFYRLLPTLIRRGRVYIAESPLYEITCKDDIYFAYDEAEKAEITAKLEGKKYTLQRSKGLGENEPDMMWQTTMNPATRRLIQVTEAEAEATARIFDTLLGDDLPARKQFIAKHGHEYLSEADI